jgi:hypothetical protein
VECYVGTMNTTDDAKRRLSKVIEQQQELLGELSRLLTTGDAAAQDNVQKRLQRLTAEHQRLAAELRFAELEGRDIPATPRARASGKTLREQTLDVLDEVGVPLSPTAIGEFSLATTGMPLQASRFASLRRDEERAARRDPASRPGWVVPALSTARLTPIPRLLASSAWEPDRRLIGARTLRVNHLRAVLAFVKRYRLLTGAGVPKAADFEMLLARHARGVPGAVRSGERLDPTQIESATTAELAVIEGEDIAERQRAAAKLSRYGIQQQLWGLPAVLDGGAPVGRVGS